MDWRLIGAGLVLLGGCATSQPTYLANGMRAYQVDCSMAVNGLNACYAVAADLCGNRGFSTYDWDGRAVPMPYAEPDLARIGGMSGVNRLLIACRS